MSSIPVNHTPHSLVIYDRTGTQVLTTLPAAVPPMRLISGAPALAGVVDLDPGEVPAIQPPCYIGIYDAHAFKSDSILVSQLAAAWLVGEGKERGAPHFTHIYAPDTGPESAVRNDKGEILGVKRFIQYK
jgi:hypothetical protein